MAPVANKVYLKRTSPFVKFLYWVLAVFGFFALLFVAATVMAMYLPAPLIILFLLLEPLLGDVSFIYF